MSNPYSAYGVSDAAADAAADAMRAVLPVYEKIDRIKEYNQLRVLEAFRKAKFSDIHMGSTTGYGYDDIGREKLETIFADVFGAEAAYVRMQISSGTQAISGVLFGLLRPGDEMLSVTGRPYDTLAESVGISENSEYDGSLADFGITYAEVELCGNGDPDVGEIRRKLNSRTKLVFIQKSKGYTDRRSLMFADIKLIVDTVRNWSRDNGHEVIVAVDNCYGEFTETAEPCAAGADICAGSLIKNPGGGICPTGGYVAGRRELVEKAAMRITAPGLGSHVGPTLGFNRSVAQGLFMAPHTVSECLKGAVFAAKMFSDAGLSADPVFDAERGDTVQSIRFGSAEGLVKLCRMVQACSPVDSFVAPEPWAMPGYEDQVVMAAGTFVQGATTELSCDGPIKPPYIAYMQGGLVAEQARLAVMLAVSEEEAASDV